MPPTTTGRAPRDWMSTIAARAKWAKRCALKIFVGVNYVNKVVGYAFSIGEGWLGGADVEVAVDLAGVGGDHLDGGVIGELKGKGGFCRWRWGRR